MQLLPEIERSGRKHRRGTSDMALLLHISSNIEFVERELSNGRLSSP